MEDRLPLAVLMIIGLCSCPRASSLLCGLDGRNLINGNTTVVNVDTTVTSGCVMASHDNYSCATFQSALQFVYSRGSCSECEYSIRLGREVHLISTPLVLNSSVVLIGDQEGVVVSCSFIRQGLPSSTLHSLYFNRSQTVGFINVHAQNCPLPFRLDSVRNTFIKNSQFR